MKSLITIILIAMSSTVFSAVTNPQDCLKQKKQLDRRYCMDSYLESVKDGYDAERSSFAKGINEKDKNNKVSATEQEIIAKKDYMNLMKTEIELQEKYLSDLKGATVAAIKAPKKKEEKKKKKSSGFKIKL